MGSVDPIQHPVARFCVDFDEPSSFIEK